MLRAAMAGRATHLLTGDRRAFGSLYGRRSAGILVLRPADYLAGGASRSSKSSILARPTRSKP